MTPAKSYARNRAEAVALIEAHAPQRLQQSLIDLLRPAIALNVERCDDAEIPLGASKFGGAPDVPDGFEWPLYEETPLLFLAQINMQEIDTFDVENSLPDTGTLSVFYGIEAAAYQPSFNVFWFKDIALSRFATPPCKSAVRTCVVSFSLQLETGDYYEELSWEDFQKWLEAQRARPDYQQVQILKNPPALLKFLGHADAVFSSVEVGKRDQDNQLIQPEPRKEDYRLLMQVNSDDTLDVMWCDVGILYFLIRKDDLASRRFDRIYVDVQAG